MIIMAAAAAVPVLVKSSNPTLEQTVLLESFQRSIVGMRVPRPKCQTDLFYKDYQHVLITLRWVAGLGRESAFGLIQSMMMNLNDSYRSSLEDVLQSRYESMPAEWRSRCEKVISCIRV